MDLNQSIECTPSSSSSLQTRDFMSMSSFMLPSHKPPKKGNEEVKQSHLLNQKRNLQLFWYQQMVEIHNITVFKSQHQLPLARIKKIMKSDKDVKMISSDTPVLFSKACELFILELTFRAWLQIEGSKRRTLHHCDIVRAIRQVDTFDFLVNVVPFINHRDDDDENFQEENVCHPVNQKQFPLLDTKAELGLKDPQVQPLLFKPPMLYNELH